jgi:hypothetical protein
MRVCRHVLMKVAKVRVADYVHLPGQQSSPMGTGVEPSEPALEMML